MDGRAAGMRSCSSICSFFFFNDTATTEIYTLSLHDAFRSPSRRPAQGSAHVLRGALRALAHARWPCRHGAGGLWRELDGARSRREVAVRGRRARAGRRAARSEEHTSELQSLTNLVCRLLLE